MIRIPLLLGALLVLSLQGAAAQDNLEPTPSYGSDAWLHSQPVLPDPPRTVADTVSPAAAMAGIAAVAPAASDGASLRGCTPISPCAMAVPAAHG